MTIKVGFLLCLSVASHVSRVDEPIFSEGLGNIYYQHATDVLRSYMIDLLKVPAIHFPILNGATNKPTIADRMNFTKK